MMGTIDLDAIRAYIQTELLGDESFEIAPDQDLLLTEILDSLAVIRLVEHIESEAGLAIPPEDVTLENFQSLRQIDAYLRTRVAA